MRIWSRVDFSIEVAYEADLKKALAVLKQVAEQLYEDPEWKPKIPEPPEVLGVDNFPIWEYYSGYGLGRFP
jgi:moderate conductance mechanosensitive channel